MKKAGFERVARSREGPGTDNRNGKAVTKKSEIWAKTDAGPPKKVTYVRIDRLGHDEGKGRAGRKPHYHVDELHDPDGPASPINNPHQLNDAKKAGVPLDNNNVPLDKKGGKPITKDENYRARAEETRTPIDGDGNQAPQPPRPGPGGDMGKWGGDMDNWADDTHHGIND